MREDKIFTPVDSYLVKSEYTREYKAFYPSDASCIVNGKVIGSCLRKQYYLWKGVLPTQVKSYKMMLSAALGNACEKFFLDIYRKKGLLKSAGDRLQATVWGLPISGKTDGTTYKRQLIEVKSAFGTAFYHSVNVEPKGEHLCQIMVYMCLGGYDECILPYMCRDNTNNRVGYVITKKEIEEKGIFMAKILQRWKILKKCLEKNEEPPCDFEARDWQCGYCVFRGICHGDAPVEVKKPRKGLLITKRSKKCKKPLSSKLPLSEKETTEKETK